MEAVYASVIIALGSTFLLFGAGFFAVFEVLRGQLERGGFAVQALGRLMLLPWSALLLGLIAVAFGLQDQTAAVARLCGHWSPFGDIALVAWVVAFVSASVCIITLMGTRWARIGKMAGTLCAISCVILAISMALLFVGADVPWSSVFCFAAVLGLPLIGGDAYAVMICEGLSGFSDAKLARRTLTLCLAMGAILGLGGYIGCFQTALHNETMVAIVDAAMSQVTLAIFALTAAVVFSLLALRSKDTGYYSTIAFVASIIGSLCVLMVLLAV